MLAARRSQQPAFSLQTFLEHQPLFRFRDVIGIDIGAENVNPFIPGDGGGVASRSATNIEHPQTGLQLQFVNVD